MNRRTLTAVGFALVLLAGVGVGQPPRPNLDEVFKRYDANKDGKLSRAEYDTFAKIAPKLKDNADAAFKRLDANDDGSLTLAEFKKLADLGAKGKGKEKEPEAKVEPKVAEKALTTDQVNFFEKKIRPVLIDKCYSCHSEKADKLKGGLTLDTKAGLRTGGDSGPAVVPGNPGKSLLIHALKESNGAKPMPPKEKLSPDAVADFEKWVAMGAPDPRTDASVAKKPTTIDIAKGKEHWSFQPVKAPAIPAVSDAKWPTSDADRFVLAKLDEKKLTPAADADKRTLLRRVYFDLVGLPPAPEDVEAFVNDPAANAFEKVVDKLLASPSFGEKWGRHWLDVARYAESSGKEQNMLYPFAWRYRDYVIASFNADKPYDQFLKEQLAGDLMPAKNDNEKAEHQIATGFLAVGTKSHNERNALQFRLDLADEQIDAMSQGMLGLTVACARCHDHKFDPIPTKDYYALVGIFTSTDTKYGTPQLPIARNNSSLQDLPSGADVPTGATLSKAELDRIKAQLADLKKQRDEAFAEARKGGGAPVRLVVVQVQLGILERQVANYDSDGKPKKLAMAVGERSFPRDGPVYARGEPEKPGEIVPRGFVSVLNAKPSPKISSGSGRKELAEWVASKDNPLTARVMANRVWQHLFGQGIVASPDNFGTTGQAPSNQDLLDHLAAQFVRDGWSVKKLVKSLVLSHSYRMSSDYHEANAAADPDNVFHWRMSKRRLDAEAIRDAMYAVAGQLDTATAVGSPIGKFEGPVQGIQRFGGFDRLNETNHRSIYLPVVRDNVPEVLELFDFAEPSLVTGARDDTSVPSQALYLMNNPQVMKLADKTAERLTEKYLSPTERIDGAFRLAFARPATASEAKAAEAFLAKFVANETRGLRKKADVEKSAWAALAQALFAAAEFRYID